MLFLHNIRCGTQGPWLPVMVHDTKFVHTNINLICWKKGFQYWFYFQGWLNLNMEVHSQNT